MAFPINALCSHFYCLNFIHFLRSSLDLPSEYCVFPFVKCPGGDTKYPVICKLSCRAGYTMEGSDMVSCQNTGSWSPSQTYCKRINKPPSDVSFIVRDRKGIYSHATF